jgi:hypothetical protein
MANTGTIDSELLFLNDGFGCGVAPSESVPVDGFMGASHHNVATAAFTPGTQVRVKYKSVTGSIEGYSIFTYLCLGNQSGTLAAKGICNRGSATDPYTVGSTAASSVGGATGCGPVAIALSAMTTGRYGWFWTGGGCPETISGAPGTYTVLGGNYLTDDTVGAGAITASTGAGATAYLVFRAAAVTDLSACGYSLAADTST